MTSGESVHREAQGSAGILHSMLIVVPELLMQLCLPLKYRDVLYIENHVVIQVQFQVNKPKKIKI